MSSDNSDNSEMKVIRNVRPEEIQQHFIDIGCNDLAIAVTDFEITNQRSIDSVSQNAGATGSDATSNTGTSSSGTDKMAIEFQDNGMAHLSDLLRPEIMQTLKLESTDKRKDVKEQPEKDVRE